MFIGILPQRNINKAEYAFFWVLWPIHRVDLGAANITFKRSGSGMQSTPCMSDVIWVFSFMVGSGNNGAVVLG
jgi:hypothetical protein